MQKVYWQSVDGKRRARVEDGRPGIWIVERWRLGKQLERLYFTTRGEAVTAAEQWAERGRR